MAISFKEQIDNFSNDFYINTAYIPYIRQWAGMRRRFVCG